MDYREKSSPDLTKKGKLPIAQKEKTARRANKAVLFGRQCPYACAHGIVGITREGVAYDSKWFRMANICLKKAWFTIYCFHKELHTQRGVRYAP